MSIRYSLFLFCTIFLLIGAGCIQKTDTTENTSEQSSTSTEQAILKAPTEINLSPQEKKKQSNENICKSQGYDIITRFNTLQNSSVAYCHFPNGSECILTEFVTGLCTPASGSGVQSSYDTVDPIIGAYCDTETEPVCGENGHTYANACLAIQTSISIKHTGRCTPEEIAVQIEHDADSTKAIQFPLRHMEGIDQYIEEENNNQLSETSPNIVNPIQTSQEIPNWINKTISLLESEPPTVPARYIDSCTRGGYQYYIETNGTGNIQSTAFTPEGNIICYPNKDFRGQCPEEILLHGSCTRIYTDTR